MRKGIFAFLSVSFQTAPSNMFQEEGKIRNLAWGAQNLRDKNVILQAMTCHGLAPAPIMCLPSSTVTQGRTEQLQKTFRTEMQPTPQQYF